MSHPQLGDGASVAYDEDDRDRRYHPARDNRPRRPARADHDWHVVDDEPDDDLDAVDEPTGRRGSHVDDRKADNADVDKGDSVIAFGIAASIIGLGAALPFLPASWILPAVAVSGGVATTGLVAFAARHRARRRERELPEWLRSSGQRPRLFGGGRERRGGPSLPKLPNPRAKGALGRALKTGAGLPTAGGPGRANRTGRPTGKKATANAMGSTGLAPKTPKTGGLLGKAMAARRAKKAAAATRSAAPGGAPKTPKTGGLLGKAMAARRAKKAAKNGANGSALSSRLRTSPNGPRSSKLLTSRHRGANSPGAATSSPATPTGKTPRTLVGKLRQARKQAKQTRTTALQQARHQRQADKVQRRVQRMKDRWDRRDARADARRQKRQAEATWYRAWWKRQAARPVNGAKRAGKWTGRKLRKRYKRARKWVRRRYAAVARGASARWKRIVAKHTPQWVRDLRSAAGAKGKKFALGMALVMLGAAMKRAGLWTFRQVWAKKPATTTPATKTAPPAPPRSRAAGRPPVAPTANRPVRPARPTTTATPRSAGSPWATGPTRPSRPGTGGTMHPALASLIDAQHQVLGSYDPPNVRDFENFLRTQPAALYVRGQHCYALANYLIASHPGAQEAQGFFFGFGDAFAQQAGSAHLLHMRYKGADKATMDRFESPRINEWKADVPSALNTAQHIGLDTREMHERHLQMIEASSRYVAGFQPADTAELLSYLSSLPEALITEGLMYRDFGGKLAAYPLPKEVPSFFVDYGSDFGVVASVAAEVGTGFRAANPDDAARAEDPHPRQEWNNVSVPS